jgi:hypothetical protein
VGLHKNIETQEKEISDLKAESNQIQIENRRHFTRFASGVIFSSFIVCLHLTV